MASLMQLFGAIALVRQLPRIKECHTWMVNWRRSCSFCRWNLKRTPKISLLEPFHFIYWNPNRWL